MSRIRYGITSVYYAVITEGEEGNVTYATPVALPGAKSISLSAAGDKLEEYADNSKWYVENVNQGFSGDLVVEDTAACDTFLETVLGLVKNPTDGTVLEKADAQTKEFALGFQFELKGGADGENGKRTWLYRCVASRPDVSGDTKESSITVATNTINITAMPRLSDSAVKISATAGAKAYENWFQSVVEQTAQPSNTK